MSARQMYSTSIKSPLPPLGCRCRCRVGRVPAERAARPHAPPLFSALGHLSVHLRPRSLASRHLKPTTPFTRGRKRLLFLAPKASLVPESGTGETQALAADTRQVWHKNAAVKDVVGAARPRPRDAQDLVSLLRHKPTPYLPLSDPTGSTRTNRPVLWQRNHREMLIPGSP